MEVGFAMVGHKGVHHEVETRHVVSLAMLPSEHSELLNGPVSVVLASRNPNGSKHLSPVRLGRDERYLYLAAGHGQVVHRNLQARPDVSFLLVDPADPYRWMSVSAQVEPVADDGEGRSARHGGLIDEFGPSTARGESTVSGGNGRPNGDHTLYRARPDRLMVFEKCRPGL